MEEIIRYVIRLRERARRDIEAEMVRLSELTSDSVALDWMNKLLDQIATLNQMPQRCPIAREAEHVQREVRQMIYRRASGGPAWRILFTVEEGDDGPTVLIRHVRHGARLEMTRDEVYELEAAE